jgi:phage-related minor tail protein
MKRIIFGIIVGIILFYLFLTRGGSDYLKKVGDTTKEVGSDLKQYEERLKTSTKKAKDVAEKAGKRLKEHLP